MPCYGPIRAFYGSERSWHSLYDYKRPLVFKRPGSFSGVPVSIACGQCVGCRLERVRQWAMRCLHEKRVSSDSSFVTLTYDDDHLPDYGTLVKRDMQLFMKRLRKRFGAGVRFFGCGEYGTRTFRPHYHILLFNCYFADRRFYKRSKDGSSLYWSGDLEKIWTFGDNVIGDVNYDTAAYVAGYVMDKLDVSDKSSPEAVERERLRYERYSPSGEVVRLQKEFVLMSRRPGIGTGWFQKYGADAYVHDSVIVDGVEVPPPRAYDLMYEKIDPRRMAVLKRKRRARVNRAENSPERRRVRERVVLVNLARKQRSEI